MKSASYYNFHQLHIDLNDNQDQAPVLPFLHHDQDQLNLKVVHASSSSSSSSPPPSCPNFFNPSPHDQAPYNYQHILPYPQDQVDNFVESSYDQKLPAILAEEKPPETGLKFTLWKEEQEKGTTTTVNDLQQPQQQGGDHSTCSSFKWMSSKTRIMKKMIIKSNNQMNYANFNSNNMAVQDSKQPYSSSSIENYNSSSSNKLLINDNISPNDNNMISNSNNDALIRVCSDCNTTKTPLWRSGPNGPKSLCNACGIRQRKARRALAAAVANGNSSKTTNILAGAANTTKMKTTAAKLVHHNHNKEKKKRLLSQGGTTNSCSFVTQQKKRSKLLSTSNNSSSSRSSSIILSRAGGDDDDDNQSRRKLCFEEFALNLSNKLSLHQVIFPQEEKDAAILLMALSSGAFVHG